MLINRAFCILDKWGTGGNDLWGVRFLRKAYKKIRRLIIMKHIKTLTTRNLKESVKKGGCGECQTSCQSACKTSCTVGNQSCEKAAK